MNETVQGTNGMDGSANLTSQYGYIFGRVKWYSAENGYGFVVCDETGSEALLHQSALLDFGQNSIASGCEITATTCTTAKGLQIVKIIAVHTQQSETDLINQESVFDISDMRRSEPAKVKWFSNDKNFGFVNVFGDDRDCFLHSKTLEKAGLGPVTAGEALGVIVHNNADRRVVVSVRPWL